MRCHHKLWNKDACNLCETINCGEMRAGSVHVRHAIVDVQCVNVVIGVVHVVLLVVRVVPIFLVVIL